MAVTGAIFNSLIYGGIDSADYGIYITGEAVYNAPERAVDLVSVPGRNGAIAIDQGRFENIEIEYPAGCFADDQTAFATAISDFRNAIMSQLGYQRLTDGYHPDEYRMALYISGIEVSPVRRDNGYAGEFTIRFNAKPQRWLTSGEDPVSVTSGDEITNPTLFEASPLLMVDGYGTLTVNGYDIELSDEVYGTIVLADSVDVTRIDYTDQVNKFSVGDSLAMSGAVLRLRCMVLPTSYSITNVYVSRTSGSIGFTATTESIDNRHIRANLALDDVTYSAKQDTTATSNFRATIHYTNAGGTAGSSNITFTLTVTNTASGVWSARISNISSDSLCAVSTNGGSVVSFIGTSTKSVLGTPTYLDCDLGEVYTYENDEIASLNGYVDLGSDLPVLAPGANEITYDNTITDLEVAPRWWKI